VYYNDVTVMTEISAQSENEEFQICCPAWYVIAAFGFWNINYRISRPTRRTFFPQKM
jgi:hypothetical protein